MHSRSVLIASRTQSNAFLGPAKAALAGLRRLPLPKGPPFAGRALYGFLGNRDIDVPVVVLDRKGSEGQIAHEDGFVAAFERKGREEGAGYRKVYRPVFDVGLKAARPGLELHQRDGHLEFLFRGPRRR